MTEANSDWLSQIFNDLVLYGDGHHIHQNFTISRALLKHTNKYCRILFALGDAQSLCERGLYLK